MRPRLSKTQLTSSPSTPRSYTPVSGPKPPRRTTNIKVPPLVFVSHHKTLVQKRYLPPLPGYGAFVDIQSEESSPTRQFTLHKPSDSGDFHENPFIDEFPDRSNMGAISRHRLKRTRQWERWQTDVIPRLIGPYMNIVCETEFFRQPVPQPNTIPCVCNESSRHLDIIVVHFAYLEQISIRPCNCNPAAEQLLQRQCFPCAPLEPTLAVDLQVLEFVGRLFLHISPNSTAWCKTVKDFLDAQGYKLTTRDSLRKRFSTSLQWYTTLKHATTKHVDSVLHLTRQITTGIDDGLPSSDRPRVYEGTEGNAYSSSPVKYVSSVTATETDPDDDGSVHTWNHDIPGDATPPSVDTSPTIDGSRKRLRDDTLSPEPTNEDPVAGNPFPEPPPRVRPSDYLRSRCPLCFGGLFPRPEGSLGSDAIVCLDACFTQKHNNQEKDPPCSHPRSVFLPEERTNLMQEFVETRRHAAKPAKRRRINAEPGEEHDSYEGSLLVPKSALDGCESGFTTADDRRKKASTQFFDDTALMAMLCRHDIVLWIVNMKSAGEKQHYALSLIETLFQHLPSTFTIGVLYDIGCQLHRSCIKWGFLDRYLDRLSFGILVFHAYGHQWPCQIIYHPRKCVGFGLSDGEGCERFWHSISKLISYLRVCGSYQRIYTLDSQVEHDHIQSLDKLGQWLLRRSQHCHAKRHAASAQLQASGQPEHVLRAQWAEQVKYQTQPLPRQSKGQAKSAIEDIIRLRKAKDILMRRIEHLENNIMDPETSLDSSCDAEMRLEQTRGELNKTTANIRLKEQLLGVNERTQLQRLTNNPFVAARMNAHAIKLRLREKLRARKFELERLERSFRKQVNEQKIHSHTEASVKRQDPSIQQLAQNYNKLCDEMARLIRERKAPSGVVCPPKIARKGLFALDVDDEIWQDIGLDDGSAAINPPPWLSNEQVRQGIRSLLEHDRCLEEEMRLRREWESMREWFREEWSIVTTALEHTDSRSLRYQLSLRKTHLCRMCANWHTSIQSLVGAGSLSSWGPSSEELLEARVSQVTAAVAVNMESEDDESNSYDSDTDEEDQIADITLLDTLDEVEAQRAHYNDDYTW